MVVNPPKKIPCKYHNALCASNAGCTGSGIVCGCLRPKPGFGIGF